MVFLTRWCSDCRWRTTIFAVWESFKTRRYWLWKPRPIPSWLVTHKRCGGLWDIEVSFLMVSLVLRLYYGKNQMSFTERCLPFRGSFFRGFWFVDFTLAPYLTCGSCRRLMCNTVNNGLTALILGVKVVCCWFSFVCVCLFFHLPLRNTSFCVSVSVCSQDLTPTCGGIISWLAVSWNVVSSVNQPTHSPTMSSQSPWGAFGCVHIGVLLTFIWYYTGWFKRALNIESLKWGRVSKDILEMMTRL